MLVIVPSVDAQTVERLGTYQFAIYLSDIEGPFIGAGIMEVTETTENITTHYGTFSNVIKHTQSDLKLVHETHGYLEILDSISYYDSNAFLRRSEQGYLFNVTGYDRSYWSSKFEYGRYSVVQDTETVYEERYEQRFYVSGIFVEEVECIDLTMLENPYNVTVPAGTFECETLRTYHYESGEILGYTYSWIDNEGSLIQQDQYDENNTLTGSIVLLVMPGFTLTTEDIMIIGYFSLLVLGVVAVVYILKKK
jgi:hypothetical protein